jgi:hypothetical protein
MRPVNAAVVAVLVVVPLMVSCSSAPPPGSAMEGYSVHGYVGVGTSMPAMSRTLTLINVDTQTAIANTQTNWMGKYSFSGLTPGHYLVKVEDKTMDIYLVSENYRLDIDLNAKDGVMKYGVAAAKGGGAAGQPGGNPDLAKQFTGKYYSYTGGSTLSGGGGSESRIAFCPDGSFFEAYESGYYGSGQWGGASQSNASGTWAVEGTLDEGTATIQYRSGKTVNVKYRAAQDKGCYYFDSRLYCFEGACD